MQVMFRTAACGPGVHFEVGKVYQIPTKAAKVYLDGGYAHEVEKVDGEWVRISTLEAPSTIARGGEGSETPAAKKIA